MIINLRIEEIAVSSEIDTRKAHLFIGAHSSREVSGTALNIFCRHIECRGAITIGETATDMTRLLYSTALTVG